MTWLTRKEQLVLVAFVVLFLVGWSVKVWRGASGPAPAATVHH